MSIEYKTIEYHLHEILVQLQELLTMIGADEQLQQRINECKNLIKTKKYNIAVMGECKRGKSSLINAILGAKILPADVTPATATINRITYGLESKAMIRYKDGQSQSIHISELRDYVTKITSDGEARAARISEAIVYHPTVICQNHIDIIDTPGLNADEQMARVTIEMLKSIDAVIVAIHARAPFSETEKNFVCQLLNSEQIHNIIFVVTFIDQLDEEDYEYDNFIELLRKRIYTEVFAELHKRNTDEAVLAKAHEILDNVQIFGVSAQQALKYFLTNNREALKQSRFEAFNTELIRIVTAKQLENAVQKTVYTVREILHNLDSGNKSVLAKIREEIQALVNGKEEALHYGSSSQKALDNIFVDSYNQVIARLSAINNVKEFLVSKFLQHLSRVMRTNEGIRAAITAGAVQNYDYMDKIFKLKINKDLQELLHKDLSKISAYRQKYLIKPLEKIGATDAFNNTSPLPAMEETIEDSLGKVNFAWKASPLPNTPDLLNCNPVDSISAAVDISVNEYSKEYRSCLAAVRKKWFSELAAEKPKIKELLDSVVQSKVAELEAQLHIQTKNFEKLMAKSKKILQNNEALWQEFKK